MEMRWNARRPMGLTGLPSAALRPAAARPAGLAARPGDDRRPGPCRRLLMFPHLGGIRSTAFFGDLLPLRGSNPRTPGRPSTRRSGRESSRIPERNPPRYGSRPDRGAASDKRGHPPFKSSATSLIERLGRAHRLGRATPQPQRCGSSGFTPRQSLPISSWASIEFPGWKRPMRTSRRICSSRTRPLRPSPISGAGTRAVASRCTCSWPSPSRSCWPSPPATSGAPRRPPSWPSGARRRRSRTACTGCRCSPSAAPRGVLRRSRRSSGCSSPTPIRHRSGGPGWPPARRAGPARRRPRHVTSRCPPIASRPSPGTRCGRHASRSSPRRASPSATSPGRACCTTRWRCTATAT